MSIDGRLAYASTHRHTYVTPYYLKGIAEQPQKTEDLGHLIPSEFIRIIELMGYNGCACFNYKLARGAPIIFEMNPRVGGSFSMHIDNYLDAYLGLVAMNHARAKSRIIERWPGLTVANIAKHKLTRECLRVMESVKRNWRAPGAFMRRRYLAWTTRFD
jgi:hypothetical protein